MPDLYGRTQIFTSAEEIDKSNVRAILNGAIQTHNENVEQIEYLYDYYKGKTDILQRSKQVRSDILNQINESRAKEIVDFKTSYLVGEDIVYSVSDEELSETTDLLNQLCKLEGKSTKDYNLVEWQMIAGTAYRAVFPKDEYEEGDSPFTIDTVDPRQAFVIYANDIHKKPKACVFMLTDDDGITWYWMYTHDKCFKLNDDDEDYIEEESWTLYYLPIVEYPANSVRMGAFECVIDLLDAINELDSNRLDAIQEFVQALLVLVNCKLPEGYTTTTLAQSGLIELVSNADNPAKIEMICNELNQEQTQTLKDDMYEAVLTICAMPSRNVSDTGSNGLAVIYRDGWSAAETAARTSQKMIEQSEFEALRLMLRICDETNTLTIPLMKLHIDFTRNHYENLELKATVLIQLLNNDKVHPLTAYEVCGLFADPNARYRLGMEWYEKQNGVNANAGTEDIAEPSAAV